MYCDVVVGADNVLVVSVVTAVVVAVVTVVVVTAAATDIVVVSFVVTLTVLRDLLTIGDAEEQIIFVLINLYVNKHRTYNHKYIKQI